MSTPTRLFLLRHGEVETRYHRVFGGRIDMELSERGHQQADRLAGWLARHPVDSVYASPMRRVQLTLDPFRQHYTGEVKVLPGLREVDFGDWTGLGWDEVHQRFGVSAYDWLLLLERNGISGAEPLPDYQARIAECLEVIQRDRAGKTVAVFCHGGVIRMALAILLRQPLSFFEHIEIDYASVTWLDVGQVKAGRPRTEVQLLNFSPWRDLP